MKVKNTRWFYFYEKRKNEKRKSSSAEPASFQEVFHFPFFTKKQKTQKIQQQPFVKK